MKRVLIALLLVAITTFKVEAQCPDTIKCDGVQFQFIFSATPNSGDIDSVTVKINGVVTPLEVDSVTGTTIYMKKGGLTCSDSSTQTKYYWQGKHYGHVCNTKRALPVKLSFFKASVYDEVVRFTWATAMEENNSHFNLKVWNQDHWTTIGVVQGVGNSSEINTYHLDILRTEESNLYALEQVDFDGNYSYSNMIVLSRVNSSVVSTFPKPAKNIVHVNLPKGMRTNNLQVNIINSIGQNLTNDVTIYPVNNGWEIQSHNLPEGAYFLQIIGASSIETKAFMIKR